MDQFNNGVGISKGQQYSSQSDDNIADIIQASLFNGELRYLSPLDFPHYFHGIISGTTTLIPTNQ
jgi:hypothetical protein